MRRPVPLVLALVVLLAALGPAGLAGCGRIDPAGDLPDPTGDLSAETTETVIYFSTGRSLMGEVRVIDRTAPYEDALRTLLEAMPQSNPDVAIVQPVSDFNSVTFADGVITIDWKLEVLSFEADDAEERLAYGAILATFGVFPEVEKVRFLVEGQESGTLDGRDIEAFWGSVSLIGQPWDVIRMKGSSGSEEATPTAGE